MEKGKIYRIVYSDGENTRVKILKFISKDDTILIFCNVEKNNIEECISERHFIRSEEINDYKEDIETEEVCELEEAVKILDVNRVVTNKDRYEVLKRQHWRCNICNESLKWNKDSDFGNETAHIDHIHPFSERFNYPNGWKNINEISNLQALCPKCNMKKHKNMVN